MFKGDEVLRPARLGSGYVWQAKGHLRHGNQHPAFLALARPDHAASGQASYQAPSILDAT